MSDAISKIVVKPDNGDSMADNGSCKAPWFVVPAYTVDMNPRMDCIVVNRCGEQVAHFEDIDDARFAVAAINGSKQ